MNYPTLQGKLIMPEYGRHIQQMVSYAMTIEEKEERTRCVQSIIHIMGNMFPYLRDVNDFKHKLWDHIAIMSDFKLDIDYPYEIVKVENLYERPQPVPYTTSRVKYQHYGRTIEQMIQLACEYPEGDMKNELIRLTANQMKKCFLNWNKEVVDDKKIFNDLNELSNGRLNISEDILKLVESKDLLSQNKRNKKKKK